MVACLTIHRRKNYRTAGWSFAATLYSRLPVRKQASRLHKTQKQHCYIRFLTGDIAHHDVCERDQRGFGLDFGHVPLLRDGLDYRRLPDDF